MSPPSSFISAPTSIDFAEQAPARSHVKAVGRPSASMTPMIVLPPVDRCLQPHGDRHGESLRTQRDGESTERHQEPPNPSSNTDSAMVASPSHPNLSMRTCEYPVLSRYYVEYRQRTDSEEAWGCAASRGTLEAGRLRLLATACWTHSGIAGLTHSA